MVDIKKRIIELMEESNWTEACLARNSGLSPSTVSEILHHDTVPRLKTLECICTGLGISMSQFFQENDNDGITLNDEQVVLLNAWTKLSQKQRMGLLNLMQIIAK